jgi:hypothetical protein
LSSLKELRDFFLRPPVKEVVLTYVSQAKNNCGVAAKHVLALLDLPLVKGRKKELVMLDNGGVSDGEERGEEEGRGKDTEHQHQHQHQHHQQQHQSEGQAAAAASSFPPFLQRLHAILLEYEESTLHLPKKKRRLLQEGLRLVSSGDEHVARFVEVTGVFLELGGRNEE